MDIVLLDMLCLNCKLVCKYVLYCKVQTIIPVTVFFFQREIKLL
jgi:hypothetical protein